MKGDFLEILADRLINLLEGDSELRAAAINLMDAHATRDRGIGELKSAKALKITHGVRQERKMAR